MKMECSSCRVDRQGKPRQVRQKGCEEDSAGSSEGRGARKRGREKLGHWTFAGHKNTVMLLLESLYCKLVKYLQQDKRTSRSIDTRQR